MKRIALIGLLLASTAQAQDTSWREGDRMAGVVGTSPQGQAVIPKIACTDALNNRVSCAGGGGSGGGGGDPSWTAANGSAPANNNLGLVGGWDGTNARRFLTDTSGRLYDNAIQSGTWTVGLSAGTATIGSIANTAFGATQSGTWSVGLNAGTNAIGSITNTVFGATQSGTWTVGLSAGTNLIGSINNAQVSGTAISVNTGAGDAGTQRFITANNSPDVTALNTLAGTVTTRGSAASTTAQLVQGVDSAGNGRALLTSTLGVLAAPTAGTAQSTGTVTSVAANTSTTVCPATINPVVYEVQIYGTGGVLLGLDGQALTAVTPAAGSGAYMYLPTQYTLYSGPVARTNAITAYTATAQTVVCNIVTRQ